MRILGVGHCTLDQIAVVERFPEPDFKTEMLQFSSQGGGSAATAMVALARWGMESAFVGKVGDDDRGRQIVHTIAEEGVDASNLIVQSGAISQLSFIVVESQTGKKQTYFTAGNVEPLSANEVDEAWLDDVDFLLVDGTHLDAEMRLMRAARERGVKVVLDASQNRPGMNEAVAFSDYLVASERFASQFAGVGELQSLCDALLERGPSTIVVTLGDEGCCAMDESRKMIRRDAFDVPVTDTTGAGDVFHGAVVFGIANGWELTRTVEFANVAAGLACTGIGGRGAIPSLEEVENRLA